jgi:hypothetical protein
MSRDKVAPGMFAQPRPAQLGRQMTDQYVPSFGRAQLLVVTQLLLSVIVGCVPSKSDVRRSGDSILARRYYGVWRNMGPQYLSWWVIDASGAHNFGLAAKDGTCSGDTVTAVITPNQIDVKSGNSGLVTLRLAEGDLLLFQGERGVALHKRVNRADICRRPDGTYLEGAPYADNVGK